MVSNPVVQFAAYEFLASRLVARKSAAATRAAGRVPAHPPRLTAGETFAAGAAAKLAATLVTYPMLTLKSRQQMRGAPEGGGGSGVRFFTSFFSTAASMHPSSSCVGFLPAPYVRRD